MVVCGVEGSSNLNSPVQPHPCLQGNILPGGTRTLGGEKVGQFPVFIHLCARERRSLIAEHKAQMYHPKLRKDHLIEAVDGKQQGE